MSEEAAVGARSSRATVGVLGRLQVRRRQRRRAALDLEDGAGAVLLDGAREAPDEVLALTGGGEAEAIEFASEFCALPIGDTHEATKNIKHRTRDGAWCLQAEKPIQVQRRQRRRAALDLDNGAGAVLLDGAREAPDEVLALTGGGEAEAIEFASEFCALPIGDTHEATKNIKHRTRDGAWCLQAEKPIQVQRRQRRRAALDLDNGAGTVLLDGAREAPDEVLALTGGGEAEAIEFASEFCALPVPGGDTRSSGNTSNIIKRRDKRRWMVLMIHMPNLGSQDSSPRKKSEVRAKNLKSGHKVRSAGKKSEVREISPQSRCERMRLPGLQTLCPDCIIQAGKTESPYRDKLTNENTQ